MFFPPYNNPFSNNAEANRARELGINVEDLTNIAGGITRTSSLLFKHARMTSSGLL